MSDQDIKDSFTVLVDSLQSRVREMKTDVTLLKNLDHLGDIQDISKQLKGIQELTGQMLTAWQHLEESVGGEPWK